MQQAVQQHRTVTGRQDKAVPIEPLGMGWVVPEKLRPQHIGHGCRAHRQTGMAAIGFLDSVHRQETNCVDAQMIQLGWIELWRGLRFGGAGIAALLVACCVEHFEGRRVPERDGRLIGTVVFISENAERRGVEQEMLRLPNR